MDQANGSTAVGLLRDPTFKLINMLSRSRCPDGKGMNSARIWKEVKEVVCCEETWPEGVLTGGVEDALGAPVFGLEDGE